MNRSLIVLLYALTLASAAQAQAPSDSVAGGFPRDSTPAIPRMVTEDYRVPAVAALWGLVIPGAGQIYAKRPLLGTVFFGLAAYSAYQFSRRDADYPERGAKMVLIGLGPVAWAYGLFTAADDADRYNRRRK